MLFSRTRIKRGASDSLADPLRTGAIPADLSNVAGERKGRSHVWNGIFARDQKSSCARCDGAAGINRCAYTRAFERCWSNRVAANGESPTHRSTRHDSVLRNKSRFAQSRRGDVQTRGGGSRNREKILAHRKSRNTAVKVKERSKELFQHYCQLLGYRCSHSKTSNQQSV